jgi:hypothetical protein
MVEAITGNNVFLTFLEGADGIRRTIISPILRDSYFDPILFQFRGDTVEYLTLVIQKNTVDRLKKALLASSHRWRGDEEVTCEDLILVAKIEGDETRYQEAGPNAYLITAQQQSCILGSLYNKAGIRRMDARAGLLIWKDILTCFTLLIKDTVTAYEYDGLERTIWDNMTREEFATLMMERGDSRTKYSPPWTEDGTFIVPGQIRKTTERRNIKSIAGFDELGANGWATSNGRTKEEEVEEAIITYQVFEWWGTDGTVGSLAGSDDDYSYDERSGIEDHDMNLSSSFENTD